MNDNIPLRLNQNQLPTDWKNLSKNKFLIIDFSKPLPKLERPTLLSETISSSNCFFFHIDIFIFFCSQDI